ncbi:hypothetical protein D3C86_1600390 [compost metagenome]
MESGRDSGRNRESICFTPVFRDQTGFPRPTVPNGFVFASIYPELVIYYRNGAYFPGRIYSSRIALLVYRVDRSENDEGSGISRAFINLTGPGVVSADLCGIRCNGLFRA